MTYSSTLTPLFDEQTEWNASSDWDRYTFSIEIHVSMAHYMTWTNNNASTLTAPLQIRSTMEFNVESHIPNNRSLIPFTMEFLNESEGFDFSG